MIITYSHMHRTDKYSKLNEIIWSVWPNAWVLVYELSGCGFEFRCSHLNFIYVACLERGFLDIQANIEFGFTLKRVRDMIITYSQMHRTDKYSQHSSIIWPVWLNGWVFVYELSGCGFELTLLSSRCISLKVKEIRYYHFSIFEYYFKRLFLQNQKNKKDGLILEKELPFREFQNHWHFHFQFWYFHHYFIISRQMSKYTKVRRVF